MMSHYNTVPKKTNIIHITPLEKVKKKYLTKINLDNLVYELIVSLE